MEIRISPPKNYENTYGSSDLIHVYLDKIQNIIEEAVGSEAIDVLRISLLIAHPRELAQGKFVLTKCPIYLQNGKLLAYEKFDWPCKYVAIGVHGNFERYHLGDDLDKIHELSEMIQAAFLRIAAKKKADFDCKLTNDIVAHATHVFEVNACKDSRCNQLPER